MSTDTTAVTAVTAAKTYRIPLTGRAPVIIRDDQWPVMTRGKYEYWDGQYRSQATRETTLWVKVRQHADGRSIVYGRYEYRSAWQGDRTHCYRAGYVIQPGGDIVEALHRVASDLIEQGVDSALAMDVVNRALAGLPAQDI